MAHSRMLLQIDMDPTRPVPEALAAVQAMIQANPGQEETILNGVQAGIAKRLEQMKGAEQNVATDGR